MEAGNSFLIVCLLGACAGQSVPAFLGTVGNKEFYVVPEQLTHQFASRACSGASLKLAALESQTEIDYLKNAPELIAGENYWTGGAGLYKFPQAFSWDSIGKPVDPLLFNNLNSVLPGVVFKVGVDYGTLDLIRHWASSPSPESKYPAICERILQPLSLPQLTYIGSVGGKGFYIDQNQNFTWQESLDYCHGLGLQLAAIETAKERKLVENAGLLSSNPCWTSGRLHVSQYMWIESEKPINATVSFNPEGALGITAPSWRVDHIEQQRYKALCQYLSYVR